MKENTYIIRRLACLGLLMFTSTPIIAQESAISDVVVHKDTQGDSLPQHAVVRFGSVRFKHGGSVTVAAWHPDGKHVLTGSSDRTIVFWDASTGKRIRTFGPFETTVLKLALSTDGTQFVSSRIRGKDFSLWDIKTGKLIRRFIGHAEPVSALLIAPIGKQILSAGVDGTIYLWDKEMDKPIRSFKGHDGHVASVVFSPDGTLMASAGHDHTVRLWDIATAKSLSVLRKGHPKCFMQGCGSSLEFSPDGRQLLASTNEELALLWDIAKNRVVKRFKCDALGEAIGSFSPDGKLIAICGDNTITIWDADTGNKLRRFITRIGRVVTVSFSPDGTRLVAGGHGSMVAILDANTGKQILPNTGHSREASTAQFHPDGNTILTGGHDGKRILWNLETAKPIRFFEQWRAVQSVSFDPTGKRFISSDHSAKAPSVWNTQTGKITRHQHLRKEGVWKVTMGPNGALAIGGTRDSRRGKATGREPKKVKVARPINECFVMWETQNWIQVRLFKGPYRAGGASAFCPTGKRFAGACRKQIICWDVATGRITQTLEGHKDTVNALAYSPDGSHIASAGRDGIVSFWRVDTGRRIQQFLGHAASVNSVTFSPDGQLVVAGSEDTTIRIWSVASGKQVLELKGHLGPVNSVSFSTDGKHILSASDDATALLWKPF